MEGYRNPENVRKAQIRGDRKALSAMGRAGAKKSAESKQLHKEDEKEQIQETLIEARIHEAELDNDSESIAHHEEVLRHMRGEQ